MTVTIYGIKNCDTMKKARLWLQTNDIAHVFHDYRKDGLDRAKLEEWCVAVGWDKVLNRSGTTFRNLADERKQELTREKAVALMLEQPAMIRRPVLEGPRLMIGFKPQDYAEVFNLPTPS